MWIEVHKPIDLGELARLALPPGRGPAVEGDKKDKRLHKVDLSPTTDRLLDEQTKFIIKKGGALLPPSSPLEGDIKTRNPSTKIDEPVVSLGFDSESSQPGHAVTMITALDPRYPRRIEMHGAISLSGTRRSIHYWCNVMDLCWRNLPKW